MTFEDKSFIVIGTYIRYKIKINSHKNIILYTNTLKNIRLKALNFIADSRSYGGNYTL